ncbi:hypothetical protein D3C73_1575620 [compost metagenome]
MNDSIHTRPLENAKRAETCFCSAPVAVRSAARAPVSQVCSEAVSHLASEGLSFR